MFKNALTASALSAALFAASPVLAKDTHDTDVDSASGAKAMAAAHHLIPEHGKMPGLPTGAKPRLGVAIGEVSQPQLDDMQLEYGVRITEVMPGSPAAESGMKAGDIITDVDGRPAYSPERMQYLISEASTSPIIALRRDSLRIRLEAALDAKNAVSSDRAMLGVRIQAMTEDLKEAFGAQGGHGVLVSQVRQDSAAGDAGMKAGDVIVRIGDQDITNVSDVYRIIGGHSPGDEVAVQILRDRQQQSLGVALGSASDARQAQAMHPHRMPGHGHGYSHGSGHGYRYGQGHHGDGVKGGCYAGKSLRPS